jgi:L-fuconolactonase
MKIDAHQHFWRYNNNEYSWIDDSMHVLKRDFLPEDLEQELHQAGFSGSIAVQARQNLEETSWLLSLADQNEFIKGVIGWVDLRSNNIEDQLQEFCQHPKLVGVRHVVQDEPDDNFIVRDDFLRGISLLKKYKLVYDILIFPKHLPVSVELVKMFPDQTFVLDHIAKPNIKSKNIIPWKDDITKLAAHSNVFCKLSGMVTEADWKQWKRDDFYPYLDTVFAAFSSDRLLIGSDWPVCTVAGSYKSVMAIVPDYVENIDNKESDRIFGRNAQLVYSI